MRHKFIPIDPKLQALLDRVKDHKMTKQERFEQKVSFVYGMQDFDGPEIPKEDIRKMLLEDEHFSET